MRFAFSDDQLAFRDAVGDLLAREYPPAAIRADADGLNLSRPVWDGLAEMGVPSVLVPTEEGGLGLDETWIVLVVEEAGYAGLVHPLVDTALVAAPLLGRRLATGEGTARVVTDLGGPNLGNGMNADLFVLRHGDALHAVPGHEVKLEFPGGVDPGRRLARLVGWSPDPGTVLTTDPAVVDRAFDRGVLGTAAQLVGFGRRMLDLTVGYVSQRRQFGVPVGSFQAVKHHLADARLALEFAAPAVYRAAWSLATGAATAGRDTSMAKALASDAAELVGRHALQCHGAIGYTVEYDLHLFLKRAWALSRSWGDAAWHRERVAAALDI